MKTIWRKIKTELILRLKLKPRFLILGLVLLGVALISGFTVPPLPAADQTHLWPPEFQAAAADQW